MTSIKNDGIINQYIGDRGFTERSVEEKKLIREAFQAGREYEASLFSDVIATIANELKRYRASTKEGG